MPISWLAIVNALIVHTRNGFEFDVSADAFDLNEVDGYFPSEPDPTCLLS